MNQETKIKAFTVSTISKNDYVVIEYNHAVFGGETYSYETNDARTLVAMLESTLNRAFQLGREAEQRSPEMIDIKLRMPVETIQKVEEASDELGIAANDLINIALRNYIDFGVPSIKELKQTCQENNRAEKS